MAFLHFINHRVLHQANFTVRFIIGNVALSWLLYCLFSTGSLLRTPEQNLLESCFGKLNNGNQMRGKRLEVIIHSS